jgi:hypothetical protein
MSDIYTETRFENGLRLIRSGVLILLFYLTINTFVEIAELFSHVENRDHYLKSKSTVQSDVSPVCDIQNSQFDSEACQLDRLDNEINSQLISTLWSLIPVTGIVLIFVGILRLKPDEYEEKESHSMGSISSASHDSQENQYHTLSSRVLTLEVEVKAHNEKLSSPKFYELLYGAR